MKRSFATTTINNKNATKVPRPMNCFMTYRLEKQREIVQQCPGANHRDISKIIAKWWSELSTADKEPYRRQAEKAKLEHNKMYPGYKFSPKKKVSKPRAYKKRPENEFTARDFENKQQLFALYHDGNTSTKTEYRTTNYLLDPKSSNSNNLESENKQFKKKALDHEVLSPSPSLSYQDQDYHSMKHTTASPYDTDLLYPGNHSNMYYSGSSVPSQSVYSPSTSPYYSAAGYTMDEPVGEPIVNYNLYPTHYGYPESQPAYSSVHQYHYGSSPTSYYSDAAQSDYQLKTNNYVNQQATYLHPLATITATRENPAAASFAYNSAGYTHTTSPALLTRPFYYQ